MDILKISERLKNSSTRLASMVENVREENITDVRLACAQVARDIKEFRKASKPLKPQTKGQMVLFEEVKLDK